MTHIDLSMHRSAMASMRIAYITALAERRMQTQTASDQLRFALAESHADRHSPDVPVLGKQSNFDLCRYLIGV